MGWRIWTPNEVGFYAKTLAHSYFILVILKAKFLKEKIWIVNYNLFLGKRKYYIFIDFLKFGMKTKEERSFWRKIMFITVISRSSKYKKNIYKPRRNRFFKVKCMKKAMQFKFPKKDWKKKWLKINTTILKKILPLVKKQHKYNFKNHFSININKIENESLSFKISKKFKIFNKKINSSFYLKGKLSKNFIKLKFNKITNSCSLVNKYNNLKKLNIKFVDKNILNFSNNKNYENLNLIQNRENILRNEDFSIIDYMYKSFQFKKMPPIGKLSIFGGPRKRLSRNLKRTFKGKYIKHLTNLIWFWEKIARLISYTIKKLYSKIDKDQI